MATESIQKEMKVSN